MSIINDLKLNCDLIFNANFYQCIRMMFCPCIALTFVQVSACRRCFNSYSYHCLGGDCKGGGGTGDPIYQSLCLARSYLECRNILAVFQTRQVSELGLQNLHAVLKGTRQQRKQTPCWAIQPHMEFMSWDSMGKFKSYWEDSTGSCSKFTGNGSGPESLPEPTKRPAEFSPT